VGLVPGVSGPVPRIRSVSMNGWLGYNSEAWDGPPGLIVYKKISQMLRPSPADIWVILDEREDSINDGWTIMGVDNPNQWVDLPASYHNGACGFSFADGHAEIKKWLEQSTKVPVRMNQVNGFPAPNSRDGWGSLPQNFAGATHWPRSLWVRTHQNRSQIQNGEIMTRLAFFQPAWLCQRTRIISFFDSLHQ